MTELRYPLTYQCKRCGEIYDGLRRSKTHVKEEHGIAWKHTRKELRVVGIHEPLPTIELLPSELKKGKRICSKGRSFEETAFAIEEPFAHQVFHRKIERRKRVVSTKQHRTRLIGIFAYKGYLKDLPIFGLREVVKRG